MLKTKIKMKTEPAFTIVELLVVVMVIAVLATITTVAYKNLQDRARESAVKADLSQAAKQLTVDSVLANAFPGSTGEANGGKGLETTGGTSFQYTVNNLTDPRTFCLSGINGTQGYHITQDGTPQQGVCAGHSGPSGGGSTSACSNYSIGDTGPAGGKIFHKDVTASPNVCYEAAPIGWYAATAPIDPRPEWGCYNKSIAGADGTAIGTGRQNSIDMKAAACLPYTAGNLIAATIVSNYTGGGKSDWFLPSKDELNVMYQQRSIIGGLGGAYYWSSSENSAADAWRPSFANGTMSYILKLNQNSIRPIRSFSD